MKCNFHHLLILVFTVGICDETFSQQTLQAQYIVHRSLVGSEKHMYPITLAKRSFVELVITPRHPGLIIDVIDPGDKKIKTFYLLRENSADTFSFVSSVKGDYQFLIYDSSGQSNLTHVEDEKSTNTRKEYEINDVIVLSRKAYRQKLMEENGESAIWTDDPNYGGVKGCGICWPGRSNLPCWGIPVATGCPYGR